MRLNSTFTQIGTGIPSYPVHVQLRSIAGATYMAFPVIITGNQAFALMEETGAKRFICNNADADSYQDTILVNSISTSAYFQDSLIQGDVDFFTVTATGISAPTHYQWKHNGTNVVGATNATFSIGVVQADDAGEYTVEVSNAVGTIARHVATLTVELPPGPTLSDPILPGDGSFRFNATGEKGESYRVWASEDITRTPVTSLWTLLDSDVFGAAPALIIEPDATHHTERFYLITVP